MDRTGGLVLGLVVGLLVGAASCWWLFGSGPGDAKPVGAMPAAGAAEQPSPGVARRDAPPATLSPADRDRGAAARSEPEAERVAVGGLQLDVDAAFGTLVYGRVVDQDGVAVTECSLTFTDADDRQRRRRAQVADGSGYAATGLGPGTWNVYTKPDGCIAFSGELEISADQRAVRHDVVVQRAHALTVRMVTPAGAPLSTALQEAGIGYPIVVSAVATRESPPANLPMTDLRYHARFGVGSWHDETMGMMRGRERPPPDVAGHFELKVAPPVFVSAVLRHVVLATERVAASQDEVTLTVSVDAVRAATTTVKMRVVDGETLQPVDGARVAISDRQSGGGGRPTDPDGRLELQNQRPGLVEMDIHAKGYEWFHQKLRLEPGAHDLGTVKIYRARTVRGVVVDPSGAPQAASIFWQNLDRRTFPQPSLNHRTAQSDTDGKFELQGLGRGRHVLRAQVPGETTGWLELDTARLPADPLRLVLAPVVRVAIDGTGIRAGQTFTINFFDQRRLPVWGRYMRDAYETYTELPAGDYQFEIHDGLDLVRAGRLEVRAGAAPTIRVP